MEKVTIYYWDGNFALGKQLSYAAWLNTGG